MEIDEEDGVIFPDATRFTGFAIDYTIQRGKVRGLRDGRLPVVWFEVLYSAVASSFRTFYADIAEYSNRASILHNSSRISCVKAFERSMRTS